MRAYDMVLFVFCFMLAASLFNQISGSMGFGTTIASGTININGQNTSSYVDNLVDTSNTVSNTSAIDTSSSFNWFGAVYQFVFIGIPMVVNVLFQTTVGIPFLLNDLGVPTPLTVILSTACYFIYFLGIMQWWTGKSMRDAE